MNGARTIETIFDIVHAAVGPERAPRIAEDTRLLDEGGLDSLGLVTLVAELDRVFAITISNEDLTARNFHSVRDIATLVDRYLAAAE